ncbi:hypothetical protein LCGC14_1970180 [marine sediment metagenome]|uniref:DUF35 domain-containing protein n=1 Tax=marine sediment metagenome TaxID=412755 RepID=A0A0F9FCG5_9ZZZZ
MKATAMMLPDLLWEELAPYWEGLRRHEVRLPRCSRCGKFFWYPQHICSVCWTWSLKWVVIRPCGTLFSWTVIHHAFHPLFASALPIHLGMVEPIDAPEVRLIGELINPAAADIGRGVKFEFDDRTPGMTWLKFSIANEER